MKVKAAVLREMGLPAPYAYRSHWSLKRSSLRLPALESFVCVCWRRVCATPICQSSMDLAPGRCPWCWATKPVAKSSSWGPMYRASAWAIVWSSISFRAAAVASLAPAAAHHFANQGLRPMSPARCSAAKNAGSMPTASHCIIFSGSQGLPNTPWYRRARRCASITISFRRSRPYSVVP